MAAFRFSSCKGAISFVLVVLLWPTAFPAAGAESQILVSPERAAWGRLSSLPGKQWLAVITRFARREPSRLSIFLSTNNCRAWTLRSEIREAGRKLDNGHLLTLENGTVLLTCRSLVDEQSYHLPVYRSEDQGRSWKRMGSADQNEGAPGSLKHKGLWEPFLFVLPNGNVSVIYSNEKHSGHSQVLSQKVSPDGGETWGPEIRIVVQPNGGNLRPGMGVVTRISDGRFMLVYEVVGIGRGQVHYKISPDGITWPAGLGTPIPNHEAAPYVTVLATGEVVLISCSNIISTSKDAGKTWHTLPQSSLPQSFRYTWPALYQISPDELAISISSGVVKLHLMHLNSSR